MAAAVVKHVQVQLRSICNIRHVLGLRSSSTVHFVRLENSTTNEERKAAEVCGMHQRIRISPWKLNLVAKQIRGLPIDKALIQTELSPKKAARFIREVLKDTQLRAERTFNLDPHKLYIAESYVGRASITKKIRIHGKGRYGVERRRTAHYFLKLREGLPPPKKKRKKEDHKSYKTLKLINAGPRSIPNSL